MRDKDLYKRAVRYLVALDGQGCFDGHRSRDDHGCGGVEARVHVGLSSMRSVRLSD